MLRLLLRIEPSLTSEFSSSSSSFVISQVYRLPPHTLFSRAIKFWMMARVRIREGVVTIIISVVVCVALLRLMEDMLVSCQFHSDSGAPEKFILYFFSAWQIPTCWNACVLSDLRALIFSIKPYSPAVPVAVAMVTSLNTIVAMINYACGSLQERELFTQHRPHLKT